MLLTNKTYSLLFPGCLLAGISVYAMLSYLIVPVNITVAMAVIVPVLIFGLARHHAPNVSQQIGQNINNNEIQATDTTHNTKLSFSVSNIIFIIIYVISLSITGFISGVDNDVFIPWNQFTPTQIILLTSAILLCFFLPGYALLNILESKSHKIKPVLKILLSYAFSIAIIGLAGYISASVGVPTHQIKPVLIGVYAALLILFSVKCTGRRQIRNTICLQTLKNSIRAYINELIVFGCLFALLVLSTYSLYHGAIIGDQWYHHGKTLAFLEGAVSSEIDAEFYPSFLHGALASFFTLSGVASANAYTAINFLNIIPVFAFYYFFMNWIPSHNHDWRKASLLACTFFMLSSGFGWISTIVMSVSTNPINSPLSSAELFSLVEERTLDIQRAGSFILTSSPQIGTNLTLIALPLGFILLGLIEEKIIPKITSVTIISIITTAGILAHDEFYLFIIVACLLPLIFRLPERKNSLYAIFLSCIGFIALLDIYFSVQYSIVQYYTGNYMLGVPLIVIIALFVGFTWFLYRSKIIHLVANSIKRPRLINKALGSKPRLRYLLGITIAAIVAYFYIFAFLYWGQLTGTEIHLQQDPYDLPWYIYPMKLGITGILGYSFVISYFFRKYEREVFVFGLLAIIALLLGPYYDEYRFSKYIMVAMGAFASICIYRIIVSIKGSRAKVLLSGLIIGAIVTASSLSVLISTGYIDLALQNPDFKQFSILLRNKIFLSHQEINFLNYLHNNLDLKNDHVVIPFEYGANDSKLQQFKDQRLANEIQAFVGTPLISPSNFLSSPFTFNASTIGGLYSLLSSTNKNYIILPEKNGVDTKTEQPISFAFENFKSAHKDGYALLSVPAIAPPMDSLNGVGLVYQPDATLISSSISSQEILQFDNKSYWKLKGSDLENLRGKDHEILAIPNKDKRSTFWSNLSQEENVNYIETNFRVVGENDSVIGSTGIGFVAQDKQYFISLTQKGLELSEKTSDNSSYIIARNENVQNEISTWYNLKVVTDNNSILIYLDDVLKLRDHIDNSDNLHITNIATRVDHNTAEFEPIKIGRLDDTSDSLYKKEIYYHKYYPLNEFALSNLGYSTFTNRDLSVLSHKTVMLTWDPSSNDTNFKHYLRYVNDGGNLVVIDTDGDLSGGFSKLLSIKAGNTTNFDNIEAAGVKTPGPITISGLARAIDLESANATAKSFYMNNNKKVAPFALEHKYGSKGGNIILVNSAGYFDAVFNSPKQYFMTLGQIPGVLNIQIANYTKDIVPYNMISGARFVGNFKISGNSTFASNSLLLPDPSDGYIAEKISFYNRSETRFGDNKNTLNDVLVENLTLEGSYRVTVQSEGNVSLPTDGTQYDYTEISLPNRVDMKLSLLDTSGKAAFVATYSNSTGRYKIPIVFENNEEIWFHNIGLNTSPTDTQRMILKGPQINATGRIIINDLYMPNIGESDANLTGILATLDHSDQYTTRENNVSMMSFVTYLKWVQTDEPSQNNQFALKIPGDISERAKKK